MERAARSQSHQNTMQKHQDLAPPVPSAQWHSHSRETQGRDPNLPNPIYATGAIPNFFFQCSLLGNNKKRWASRGLYTDRSFPSGPLDLSTKTIGMLCLDTKFLLCELGGWVKKAMFETHVCVFSCGNSTPLLLLIKNIRHMKIQ